MQDPLLRIYHRVLKNASGAKKEKRAENVFFTEKERSLIKGIPHTVVGPPGQMTLNFSAETSSSEMCIRNLLFHEKPIERKIKRETCASLLSNQLQASRASSAAAALALAWSTWYSGSLSSCSLGTAWSRALADRNIVGRTVCPIG